MRSFAEPERSSGRTDFRLAEIVESAARIAPHLTEATLRTQITSVMCSNAPVHHANHTDDLLRVDRGFYRRLTDFEESTVEVPQSTEGTSPRRDPTSTATASTRNDGPINPRDEWFWEGNVQSAMVSHLARENWAVLAVADTASRASGADIKAKRNDRVLWVEVKGYPSTVYARGPKQGQPKPTAPATQARVWFSNALLTGMTLRVDHPEDDVVLCFPAFTTYLTFSQRLGSLLRGIGIDLVFIDEDGKVSDG